MENATQTFYMAEISEEFQALIPERERFATGAIAATPEEAQRFLDFKCAVYMAVVRRLGLVDRVPENMGRVAKLHHTSIPAGV